MRVVDPGHDSSTIQVNDTGSRTGERTDFDIGPRRTHPVGTHRQRLNNETIAAHRQFCRFPDVMDMLDGGDSCIDADVRVV